MDFPLLQGVTALPKFDGATYIPDWDAERLTGLWLRVWNLMLDGRYRTLKEIQEVTGGSEAGISARLRDFRKARFGGHEVKKQRRGDPSSGLFEYQVIRRMK